MDTTGEDKVTATEAPPLREQVRTRTAKDYGVILLKGMAMGSADIVPGVSGGTVALIMGIYEELIESLRAFGRAEFWQALVRLRLHRVFELMNWRFLLAVGGGILLAIASLAQLLEYLLHNQEVYVWSFFFGLIVASVVTVSGRVKRWSSGAVLAFLLGTIGAAILVGLTPAQTPDTALFLFFSGALAICAMILPGISGAFILVLLGKYAFVLNAVNTRDFVTIGLIGAGAIIGLLTFAQILGWLFNRYYSTTIALLCGFMLGSLRTVWPWKEHLGGEGSAAVSRNFLPSFAEQGGQLPLALLFMGVGLLLVIGIEWLGSSSPPVAHEEAPEI